MYMNDWSESKIFVFLFGDDNFFFLILDIYCSVHLKLTSDVIINVCY